MLLGLLLASPALGQAVLDPNAAIGIEAGRFVFFPAVGTKVSLTPGGAIAPGVSVVISPEIAIQSNWARLMAELLVSADFEPDSGVPIAMLADLDVDIDLGGLWSLLVGAGYGIAADNALDPALPPTIDAVPNVQTIEGDIGAAGPIGNFGLRVEAGVVRTTHDDVLVGGVLTDQSERNRTIVDAALRLETAGGALLSPFVEATGGRRIYDQLVGSDGFLQAGNFASVRVGVAYDSAPVLSAEIAIGYHWEWSDDAGLPPTGAMTVEANGLWSPREAFTLAVATQTDFDPNASPTMGGSVSRSIDLAAGWAIWQNVRLTANGGTGVVNFADGTVERSATAGAGIAWAPNQWFRLSAGYGHNWNRSPDPTRTSSAGTFALTARVQR